MYDNVYLKEETRGKYEENTRKSSNILRYLYAVLLTTKQSFETDTKMISP